MSQKQWKRLDVLERNQQGQLTNHEAAQVLGISRRHLGRLRRAFGRKGREVAIHGNTGRRPANRVSDSIRARVLKLWRKYVRFNDTHFTEKLVEVEGVKISRRSVARILRAAGVSPARRRRRGQKHRKRRDRKPQAGMMILWDGSRHAWLEDRGPLLCLMAAVDDATGELLPGAHFVEQECSAGYLQVLLAICREKGIPLSGYMDRHGSLRRNDDHWTLEEELRGLQDPTHVGRALAALEIEAIFALSPQAKGRVERLWGTLQDRLVSELRLAGARTVEEANALLKWFRPDYNARFARPPLEVQPAWRKVRKGLDLDRICSFYYEATVQNDNTVRLQGTVIDIPPGPGGRGYARARAEVRQLLEGAWRVYYRDELIATAASTAVGELRAAKRRKRPAASRVFRRLIQEVGASLP